MIGVIVLNWNNVPDTLACLDSLAAASPRPDAVVVVDNASHDDSVDRLRQWATGHHEAHHIVKGGAGNSRAGTAPHPWLTILVADSNRGFAGGNNLGVRYLAARGHISHYLLLNNDAMVAPDCFAELDRALRAVPDAGLTTGTIYEFARPDRVWYAGGYFLPTRALVMHRYAQPPGAAIGRTEFVSGCAMLISRRALETVGLLAECYFPLYMEDAEYSYRVLAAGLPVVFAPGARFFHKVGATMGMPTVSPTVAYCQPRHRAFFVRRNLRGVQRLAALAYLVLTKPARAALELLAGRPKIARAVLRGTMSGLFSPAARATNRLD